MIEDDIQQGIRQYREEHARRFNYDIEAMWDDARSRSEQGDWPIHRWRPPEAEATPEGPSVVNSPGEPKSVLEVAPTFETT